MKCRYIVKGLTCVACRIEVESLVRQIDGVNEVRINYWTGKMAVDFDMDRVSDDEIISAVEKAGYAAKRID
ncbi:MAG: heavy-metal-associated domain-containing protein [Clostridiaceae bacterium]|nr:heavy-metal-associated domain-containing protein [Clostridiaceae bacterium]